MKQYFGTSTRFVGFETLEETRENARMAMTYKGSPSSPQITKMYVYQLVEVVELEAPPIKVRNPQEGDMQ